jgi:hypothetical protein
VRVQKRVGKRHGAHPIFGMTKNALPFIAVLSVAGH